MPDLSHLTPEERAIIENVMLRQKHEEDTEKELMKWVDWHSLQTAANLVPPSFEKFSIKLSLILSLHSFIKVPLCFRDLTPKRFFFHFISIRVVDDRCTFMHFSSTSSSSFTENSLKTYLSSGIRSFPSFRLHFICCVPSTTAESDFSAAEKFFVFNKNFFLKFN